MRLRLSLKADPSVRRVVAQLSAALPQLEGQAIGISFLPCLTAYRGKLHAEQPHRGAAVHAAAFIRKRRIVIETELLQHPRKLRLILAHEVFHFVWARLGNSLRASFARALACELRNGARGELGESAGVKKLALGKASYLDRSDACSRDYVCESFCDTAAWLYSGVKTHPDFSLAKRWSERRRLWFRAAFAAVRSY